MPFCPSCSFDSASAFPISYLFQDREFLAVKCKHCGFIYIDPRPSISELSLMYSDDNFLSDGADFGAHSPAEYETAAVKGSVKFPAILERIRQFRESGRFFEVGCGMGYFLDFVKQNGFQASGIEYSALGTKIGREKFGLNILQTSFEDFIGTPGSYDVIFFGDVVERLTRPLEMLRKAHRLLAPRGIVVAEIPSQFNCLSGRIGAFLLSLLGKRKQMPIPPYLLNEFLPSTLEKMLLAAGFNSVSITQRINHPKTIALRGTAAEKFLKLGLQYPNYLLTNSFGILGDRLLGIGVKQQQIL